MPPSPSKATISQLPDPLLGRIFAACGKAEGRTLVQVCRRWRTVACSEPSFWHTLRLILSKFDNQEWIQAWLSRLRHGVGSTVAELTIEVPRGAPGWQVVQALLGQVQPQLQALTLSLLESKDGHTKRRENQSDRPPSPVPTWGSEAAVVAAILGAAAPPLQPPCAATAAVLGSLAACFPRLQSLDINEGASSALPPCLTAVLPQLPQLSDLHLSAPALPEGLADSVAQCTGLTRLQLVSVHAPLQSLLALTRLQRLEDLDLLTGHNQGGPAAVPMLAPAEFPALKVYRLRQGRSANQTLQVTGVALQSCEACLLGNAEAEEDWQLDEGCRGVPKDYLGITFPGARAHAQAHALAPALSALLPPACLPPKALMLSGELLPGGMAGCARHLARLRSLRLSNCKGVEQWLGPLLDLAPGLTSLRLVSCQLRALPPAVAALQGLRELCLRDNRLTGLPPGPYLSGLRYLDLHRNPLASLPPALSSASALVELNMSDTRLDCMLDEVAALLAALPRTLCTLDLRNSWMGRGELALLQGQGRARGLAVLGNEYSPSSDDDDDGYGYGGEDGGYGWGPPGYDSSTSDSSDEGGGGGGPRYSWGGCAYASCWYD